MHEPFEIKASSMKKIAFIVFLLHAAFFSFVAITSFEKKSSPCGHLLVQTVVLSPKAGFAAQDLESVSTSFGALASSAPAQGAAAAPSPSEPQQEKQESTGDSSQEEDDDNAGEEQNVAPKPSQKPKIAFVEKKRATKKQTKKRGQTHSPKSKGKPTAKPQKKKPSNQAQNSSSPSHDEGKLQRNLEMRLGLVSDAMKSLERASGMAGAGGNGSNGSGKGEGCGGKGGKGVSKIGLLQSDSITAIATPEVGDSPFARNYISELVSRLKLNLRLPEYGEVRIQLTLTRDGAVKKVSIVSAKSHQNKQYVLKTVPHLSFPKFGDNFEKEPEHTFSLNLSNEINY